jgi:competence protein ComEC
LTTCRPEDWIVLTAAPVSDLPCHVFTPETLRETGAVALFREDGKIRKVTARQVTGARLWNTQ